MLASVWKQHQNQITDNRRTSEALQQYEGSLGLRRKQGRIRRYIIIAHVKVKSWLYRTMLIQESSQEEAAELYCPIHRIKAATPVVKQTPLPQRYRTGFACRILTKPFELEDPSQCLQWLGR